MIITETVDILVTARTVNHYKKKGYKIPMRYSEKSKKEVINSNCPIVVKIQDLPNNSHTKIKYKCDNCGKIFTTSYVTWVKSKYKELGDLCKNCAVQIKLPKSMEDKYGDSNPSKVSSIMDKKKQTNLNKYGNEWSIASKQVREKIVESFVEKYGVDNPMKDNFIQQKAKNTNCIKYGGNSPLCDSDIREKSRQTCLNKYGVENAYQLKEFQEKARNTLYKNGNVPISKAEQNLCKILKEMFGEDNCYPSYPFGSLSLDCLVILDNIKIDFEYDGFYWHKNRGQYDAARNAVLLGQGYKIIRVKANNQDIMPSKQQIQNAVDKLVKNNRHLIFIDMNN